MRKLTDEEIYEVIANELREKDDCEPEMMQTTIDEIISIYHALKHEEERELSAAEIRRIDREKRLKSLQEEINRMNDKLKTALIEAGYVDKLFRFEERSDSYSNSFNVCMVDIESNTVISCDVFKDYQFVTWAEDVLKKIETYAYLKAKFDSRIESGNGNVNGLSIKHRDTYHVADITPLRKARHVNVFERLLLDPVRDGRYLSIDTSDNSFVLVQGDNLSAAFEYLKEDVPVKDIENVMAEIDEIYNSIRGIK